MRSLTWLAAELVLILALVAGGLSVRPFDCPGLDRPAPKKEKPAYHTTDKTKFYVDGVEVTEKQLNAHDGLEIEELVIVGDEVTVLKVRTKKGGP